MNTVIVGTGACPVTITKTDGQAASVQPGQTWSATGDVRVTSQDGSVNYTLNGSSDVTLMINSCAIVNPQILDGVVGQTIVHGGTNIFIWLIAAAVIAIMWFTRKSAFLEISYGYGNSWLLIAAAVVVIIVVLRW